MARGTTASPAAPPSAPPRRGERREDSPRYKWWVVFMLWFVCFFNYADRQAIFASLFDAIAFGGIIYLVAAGLVVAAMLLFARQERRAQSR